MTGHRLARIFKAYFKARDNHTLRDIVVNTIKFNDTNAVFDVCKPLFAEIEALHISRFKFAVSGQKSKEVFVRIFHGDENRHVDATSA